MHSKSIEDIARIDIAVGIARISAIGRKRTGVCDENGSLWPRLSKVP